MRVLSREDCGKILGSLSKHDGDSNKNGKRTISLDKQNNDFARASRSFVNFSAVVARLQCETAKFHVLSRTGTKGSNFLFLFQNFYTAV